ncbi:MAG: DUF975 family protein [Clostridia bacterium]|nr:DUF975 family protein [Clostridia bacterium]
MDRKMLKYNARQQLGGGIFQENWLIGLVVVLIYMSIAGVAASFASGITSGFSAFSSIFSFVSSDTFSYSVEGADIPISQFMGMFTPIYIASIGSGLLVNILLAMPLTYGIEKTFLDLVMGGNKVEINTLFSGFRKYGEVVLLGFMRYLFTFLWTLLFIIPGIVKTFAYALSYYVKIDHPEYTWKQCLKESERLMKGYKFSYFVLMLSFIGWYIVGALALGVGVLWVYPYQFCTEANFYAWRVANDTASQPEVSQAYYGPVDENNYANEEAPARTEAELQDTESISNTAEQTNAEDLRETSDPTDVFSAESSDLPASDEMPETIGFSETAEFPEEPVISTDDNALSDASSETEE